MRETLITGSVHGTHDHGGERDRRDQRDRRRAREFEAYVAGAGGRLLHAAALLTGEPPGHAPEAEQLLVTALARTYAGWHGLRGEDPYDHSRQELVLLYHNTGWRYRRSRGGLLGPLSPQERLVVVLRLHEGIAEQQVAALLGLPLERVHALCLRGMATVLSTPRTPEPPDHPWWHPRRRPRQPVAP
ncbi:sigma factor-like helix-turn-helix DNA-binding protein [Streptomyces sp. NPDC005438]|uniref:sigma factor-like helix-turn-helix DNA-binding protein n=1 Tax=Streptomyces sp. NPDC005438 TaxID=3156880 RepID=UPI0033BB6589